MTHPLYISCDTYFIILGESSCRVVAADFDAASVQYCFPLSMDLVKSNLRQQASTCMDTIWKKAGLRDKYLGYLDRE